MSNGVTCYQCKDKTAEYGSEFFPFCCAECKLAWGESRFPYGVRRSKLTIPQIQERLRQMGRDRLSKQKQKKEEDLTSVAEMIFGSKASD